MRIEIEILRAAIGKLLDHAEQMRGSSIEVDEDLYWFIPKESMYDPTTDPRQFTLGSLGDDWSEVSAIGKGEKEAFGHALVWASSVLRALGDRTL